MTPSSKGSQPIKPTFGFATRLMDQVLSTAEAHLQPDFGDGGGKELGYGLLAECFEAQAEARQCVVH